MKNLYLIFLLLLIGCNTLHINNSPIESIIIEEINTGLRKTITDQKQISRLLKCINSSSREFFIFKPNYLVTIIYKDKENKQVLIKNEALKIDDVTYKSSKQISFIIETYFE